MLHSLCTAVRAAEPSFTAVVKSGDLYFHYYNFSIEMDIDSENVDFIEKVDKEVYTCGDITDLDLEIKIEKLR